MPSRYSFLENSKMNRKFDEFRSSRPNVIFWSYLLPTNLNYGGQNKWQFDDMKCINQWKPFETNVPYFQQEFFKRLRNKKKNHLTTKHDIYQCQNKTKLKQTKQIFRSISSPEAYQEFVVSLAARSYSGLYHFYMVHSQQFFYFYLYIYPSDWQEIVEGAIHRTIVKQLFRPTPTAPTMTGIWAAFPRPLSRRKYLKVSFQGHNRMARTFQSQFTNPYYYIKPSYTTK